MTGNFDDAGNPSAAQTPVLDDQSNAGSSGKPTDIDVGKLQKRLDDSQAFISTLKQERDQDRQLIETVTQKLEVILRAQELGDEPASRVIPPTISAEELRKQGFVTREDLEREQREIVARSNLQSVLEIGRKQFGDKLNDHINSRCKEIGVDVNWAKAQAASNPNVFIELFGLKKQGSKSPQPIESDVGTSQFRERPEPVKESIMYGASTESMLSAWRKAAPQTE